MDAYTYIREREKRLIARLETLGYPLGITMRTLAKLAQCRARLARQLNLDNI